eukprot:10084811-Karenia_brevis.AAC.1
MATAVPHKGGRGMFASARCLDLIGENGVKNRDLLIKTDQEPASTCSVDGGTRREKSRESKD